MATAFTRWEQIKHAQSEHLNCNKIDGGRGGRDDKDRPPRPCYCCGEVGHFAQSCPEKKEKLICKYPPCKGATGHVIKVCKKKRRDEREKKDPKNKDNVVNKTEVGEEKQSTHRQASVSPEDDSRGLTPHPTSKALKVSYRYNCRMVKASKVERN